MSTYDVVESGLLFVAGLVDSDLVSKQDRLDSDCGVGTYFGCVRPYSLFLRGETCWGTYGSGVGDLDRFAGVFGGDVGLVVVDEVHLLGVIICLPPVALSSFCWDLLYSLA